MSLRRLALASLLLPWALTGCGGPEPTPHLPDPTTTSATSSQTPSAAPVEPTPPPEIQGDDEAAAEAFVKYYYELTDYALATGDTEPLQPLGLPTCHACSNVIRGVARIHDSNGKVVGGDQRATVKSVVTLSENSAGDVYGLKVQVVRDAQLIKGTGTSLDGRYPAGRADLNFQVVRTGRGWRIAQWDLVR